MKLTDKIVAVLTLKPGETERLIADDDMTGLRLRLRRGAKGITKRWVYKYSRGAQQHSFTLDWPAHNLTAARKRAGELQAKLRLGQDPAKERRAGKAEALATMGAVLLTYLQHKRLAPNLRHRLRRVGGRLLRGRGRDQPRQWLPARDRWAL